jgi:hypothetical protein
VGTLLAHGVAPYEFNSERDESYYVTLQQADRARTLWGKDLKRALEEGTTRAQIGDVVGARSVGRVPVTVRQRDVDPDSGQARERDKTTYRNRWILERSGHWERLAASAQALRENSTPSAGVGSDRSELKEAYLHLKHAQLLAQSLTAESAKVEFLSTVREGLARAIEGGTPLTRVQIRAPQTQAPVRESSGARDQSVRAELAPVR